MREVTLLRNMCVQLWKILLCTRYATISLFFIAQRAVKAWIIENCPEKMNCGLVNNNFIDLIDFLKTAHIWPKQDFTPIGVTVANQNNSKIKKGINCYINAQNYLFEKAKYPQATVRPDK